MPKYFASYTPAKSVGLMNHDGRDQLVTANTSRIDNALLACGVIFGSLFYCLAIVQMFIRPGYDLTRHAISLLSVGDLGWIQIINFLASGLLLALCAVGFRRVLKDQKGGTWTPLLIGIAGIGMMVGGIFHPDPGLGFPPGAPAGMPTSMSTGGTIHMIAFSTVFLAIILACLVFAARCRSIGDRAWSTYSAVTGVITIILIAIGSSNYGLASLTFFAVGIIAFGWVGATARRLVRGA